MSDISSMHNGLSEIDLIPHLEAQIVDTLSQQPAPKRHLSVGEPVAYLIHRSAESKNLETLYAWYAADGNHYHAENLDFEDVTALMDVWLNYNSFADGEAYDMGLIILTKEDGEIVSNFDPCYLTKHFKIDHFASTNISVMVRKMNPIRRSVGAFGV